MQAFKLLQIKAFLGVVLMLISVDSISHETTVAYINKTEIYKGYSLFQQYHNALVKELEEADRDNTARVRELDSLYSESLVESNAPSTLKTKYERDKSKMEENQLDYVRELLNRYNEKVAQCESIIEGVIEQIVKESGYATWGLIESGEEKKDGVDITNEVLQILNK